MVGKPAAQAASMLGEVPRPNDVVVGGEPSAEHPKHAQHAIFETRPRWCRSRLTVSILKEMKGHSHCVMYPRAITDQIGSFDQGETFSNRSFLNLIHHRTAHTPIATKGSVFFEHPEHPGFGGGGTASCLSL